MSTVAQLEVLLPTDICDRCTARATSRYRLESGGHLQFCTHHGSAIPPEVISHWTLVAAGNFK